MANSRSLREISCRQGLAMTCLAFVVLVSTFGCVNGKVLGIDFGSENIKVSLVKPGRVPISIVTNEMSKRRSPGAVGFVNGERLLGEEAMALEPRYPDRVFTKVREMLGRPVDAPIIEKTLKEYYLPFKLVEHPERKTAQIETKEGEVYSAEEIVAMILHYVRKIGAAYAEIDIVDVVITVPAFYSQSQREAMLVAAELAGFNVLSLVSEHAAAALQWGIDKDFTNITQEVVLYDMGAGSVTCSLVKYSSFKGKEGGKTKTFGQFEVKHVTWDDQIGGFDLDMLLVNYFADQFNSKWGTGDDVRNYPKAMAKLKKQCKRTKEILSANMMAPISVESMHDDIDFRSDITREKFEELAGPIFQKAAAPLSDLLSETGVSVESLEAVELLGGGTRIPGVISAITTALGGRVPDRHLDSDEAVALGAGLHAANLSTAFRVRKFGSADAASYALTATYAGSLAAPAEALESSDPEELASDGGESAESATGTKTMKLLPRLKKYPVKRVVSLTHTSGAAQLTVGYDPSASALPTGIPTSDIATYTISGVDDLPKNYTFDGKVSVHFAVSSSGVLELSKAEAVVELPDPPVKEKKDKKKNTTTTNTEEEEKKEEEGAETSESSNTEEKKEEESAEENKEEKEEQPEKSEDEKEEDKKEEEEGKKEEEQDKKEEDKPEEGETGKKPKEKKKRIGRIPLKVETVETLPTMTKEEMKASLKTLKVWEKKDTEKFEAAEAKNELESYIISTREKVSYGEDVATVTTSEQREGLVADLMDAEDWLYMDGENAPIAEFRSKLASLKGKGDPIFERVQEAAERPEAVAKAKKFIEVTRQVVAAWASTKPWINETDKEALLTDVDKLDAWIEEKEEDQQKIPVHEAPAYKAQTLKNKITPLETRLAKLKKTPKPKPPKVENTTSTESAEKASTSETTGEANPEEPLKITIDDEEVIVPPPADGEASGEAAEPSSTEEKVEEEEEKDEL